MAGVKVHIMRSAIGWSVNGKRHGPFLYPKGDRESYHHGLLHGRIIHTTGSIWTYQMDAISGHIKILDQKEKRYYFQTFLNGARVGIGYWT